jgi:hypothetical protein
MRARVMPKRYSKPCAYGAFLWSLDAAAHEHMS